jgi:hypothetical protein
MTELPGKGSLLITITGRASGMRRRWVAGALAGAVGLVPHLLSMQAASASHDAVPNPDNTTHDVERISLTYVGERATLQGEVQVSRSDLNTVSGAGDVHVRDISYSTPQGWAGATWCSAYRPLSLSTCDHFQVRFNLREDETGNYATSDWKVVGCHEHGHAAGLGHRTDSNARASCMKSPSGSAELTEHDIATINGDV